MTPEPASPDASESPAARGQGGRSIGWQLIQVGVLLGLLLVGMYEVDRDAKALAEKRARSDLARAVQAAAGRQPSDSAALLLEKEIGAYGKACAACAEIPRCEETIRAIRAGMKVPAERGPCREGIFERWNSGGRT